MAEGTNGRVFVLRGIPGTGVEEFAEFLHSLTDATVLTSDDYFKNEKGELKFDQTKMQEAHKWNFKRFKEAIERKDLYIVVANTNIKRFHYYLYVDYAQKNNYSVTVTICPHNDSSNRELSARSGIDQDVIRRMKNGFEWSMEEKNG